MNDLQVMMGDVVSVGQQYEVVTNGDLNPGSFETGVEPRISSSIFSKHSGFQTDLGLEAPTFAGRRGCLRGEAHLLRHDLPSAARTFALTGMPHRVAFSADGRTLAVVTFSVIRRGDVATGEPLPPLTDHTHIVTGLVSLTDGRWLSCNQDGTVRTWDNSTGMGLDVLDWRLGRLYSLAVAPDGMRAAVGSEKGTILVWDLD